MGDSRVRGANNPSALLASSRVSGILGPTGVGTFTGETRSYGPLTWPACSAEICYTMKHVGRTFLAWRRSYYHEELFHGTDYSANGFTLRFERSF